MQPLRAVAHVGVGRAGRVVPLVVLARARQGGERRMDVDGRCAKHGFGVVGGGERKRGWPGERRAHQHHRAKHIRPRERAPRRYWRTEVMAHHRRHRAVAQRGNQAERVSHQVEHAKHAEIAVVAGVAAGGAAVAALIGRHHMKTSGGDRQHHLAPTVGEFRKAVQQQHARAPRGLEAGLEHAHGEAVVIVDKADADAGRQVQSSSPLYSTATISTCSSPPGVCTVTTSPSCAFINWRASGEIQLMRPRPTSASSMPTMA